MQFEVQALKLPSPISEKNSTVISCQVPNELSTPADNFGSRPRGNVILEGALITPKKLPNPCLESFNHQNLHKEMLFNNKIGKNVLSQKSELHKALEKHKNAQLKKEQMLEKEASKTVLEKAIQERAKKLESLEKLAEVESEKPEFLQVHAKVCAKALTK